MSSGRSLVAHWDLSTDNPPDICWRGNRYPGTGADLVGHPNGIAGGICTEFDGDDSVVNVGDIVELNAVSAFSIAFWMNQNVLDQTDYVFEKRSATEARISIVTVDDGQFYFIIANGANTFGIFDYSTIIAARSWHHISVVYDGSQTGDANRLRVYVNGDPVTLAFMSPIPATTADLAGIDTFIGRSVTAFDGKLDEFRIFDAALTQLQVIDLYERTRKGIM